MNDKADSDLRLYAIPDIHGHAKGEHKAFTDERPIPLSARMLFLWFYHACRRGWPRFLMVTDHMNYLTFEDPAAINLVRRALKLAQAGDLYGAADTASVEVGHAAVVSEGLRRGMRYSIGAEVDNDPRSRPDAQNIVDAMKPDGMIRSVHFLSIDHPAHGPNWSWPFDNPEFADVYDIVGAARTWELYMATLLDAIERLPGQIVGHFYVPAIFGHWPDEATLEAYEDQLVAACAARGMAIEFNTRFLYRNHPDEEKARYLAAHRRLLTKCKANNVGVAVGSDAHSPKDQGRGFDTILSLLDECEINELVFPIAGRLARVALRVERKADTLAATEPPAQIAAEDRKTLRKARTSEAPARPKDSSSKRDDAPAGEDTALADDVPAKSKPRPKRGKKSAAAGREDAPAAESAPASGADEPPMAELAAGAAPAGTPLEDTAAYGSDEAADVVPQPDAPGTATAEPPSAALQEHGISAEHSFGEPLLTSDEPDEPVHGAIATGQPADDQKPIDTETLIYALTLAETQALVDSQPAGDEQLSTNEQRFSDDLALNDLVIDEGVLVETVTELVSEPDVESIVDSADLADGDDAIGSSDEGDGSEERVAFQIVPGIEIDAPVGSAREVDDDADELDEPALTDMVTEKVLDPIQERHGAVVSAVKARRKVVAPKTKSAANTKAKVPAKSKPAPKKSAKPVVKAAAKKAPAKQSAAKKVGAKPAVAKKTATKKAPAKKAAARPTTVKKAGAKKPAKKTSAKKTAQKRR